MLDRDLARLSSLGPEPRLAGLEKAIWVKVEGLDRLGRIARATSRVQLFALIGVMIASTTSGVLIGAPLGARARVMQISAAAADLAPSTLLAPSH